MSGALHSHHEQEEQQKPHPLTPKKNENKTNSHLHQTCKSGLKDRNSGMSKTRNFSRWARNISNKHSIDKRGMDQVSCTRSKQQKQILTEACSLFSYLIEGKKNPNAVQCNANHTYHVFKNDSRQLDQVGVPGATTSQANGHIGREDHDDWRVVENAKQSHEHRQKKVITFAVHFYDALWQVLEAEMSP